jgi:hypothetical protein
MSTIASTRRLRDPTASASCRARFGPREPPKIAPVPLVAGGQPADSMSATISDSRWRRRFFQRHGELRRRQPAALRLRGIDAVAGERQRAQLCAELLDGQPRIDERAQQHVAADAGEAVEVGDACHTGTRPR